MGGGKKRKLVTRGGGEEEGRGLLWAVGCVFVCVCVGGGEGRGGRGGTTGMRTCQHAINFF